MVKCYDDERCMSTSDFSFFVTLQLRANVDDASHLIVNSNDDRHFYKSTFLL
jgi:hypothetical protein